MTLKRGDILLTKFDIEILEYLSDDKNKPFKKCDLYNHFEEKGNNRINDRIQSLIRNELIDETPKNTHNNKKLKILITKSSCNSLLKIFKNSL